MQSILAIMFAVGMLFIKPDAQADAGTLLSLEDGEYAIEVTLTGGSGKASIQSPALLTVTDGTAYISIT